MYCRALFLEARRKMNMKAMSYLSVAALIVSGSPLFAASSASQTPADASRLLKEVRSIAHTLNRDAATLESYRLRGLSWHGHAYRLTLARQHINSIGDRLESLQAMRGSAAPWQREAIDSIVPVAAQLASRTEAAISHLNENPGQLYVPVYTGHLSAIAGHADRMKQSVDVFLDLASAQDRLDGLRGLA
jgi:hypothetical protein